MFIPLDRLYDFCKSQFHEDIIIYGFNPPGSKNISTFYEIHGFDLLTNPYTITQFVPLIIHDQEPLNFGLYQNLNSNDLKKNPSLERRLSVLTEPWMHQVILSSRSSRNLGFLSYGLTRCDINLLSHSEKNSRELEKYEKNDFVGIYWWSHALIARDWYRFAKIDPDLDFDACEFAYDFNVYNRAWAGTREYRLKFTDFVIEKQLISHSNIKFNPYDETHYRSHRFSNQRLKPKNDLEILPLNSSTSCSSADYTANDYQSCAIDVVLETLFDDTRWHLTEKTLRPIACGKPFILVGTMGILSYLKSYGFRTFNNYIDESYDLEPDPIKRLDSITGTMRHIASLSPKSKKNLYHSLHQIAKYNKDLFWSEEFAKNIWGEFLDNYQSAYLMAKNKMTGKNYRNFRIELFKSDARWGPYLKNGIDKISLKDYIWWHPEGAKQCLIEINKFNRLK